MRVLVCGDREWADDRIVTYVLRGIYAANSHHGDNPFVVINGRARGADHHASQWALTNRMIRADDVIRELPFPADWDTHGKAAGPIRNQQMLDEGKPDLVVAFHDNLAESKGTADMVRRAKKAGVPVYVVGRA